MAAILGGPFSYEGDFYGRLEKPFDYRKEEELPYLFIDNLQANGLIGQTVASTDLLMVSNDAVSGANWASRVGGFTANVTGAPVVSRETPLYNNGGFNGANYRRGVNGFNAFNGYFFPYNVAHEVNNVDPLTYEILFRSGNGIATETILSRYIAADALFNIKVELQVGLFGYVLSAEVDSMAGNAVITQAIEPYTYYLAHIVWQTAGGVPTINIYLNGTFTGGGAIAGVPTEDNSSGLALGAANLGNNPLTSGQIIEISRHRTAFDATTCGSRFRRMTGINAQTGQLPFQAYRTSSSEVMVNNQLWRVGPDWLCMNRHGLLIEDPWTNEIVESCFDQALAFWTDISMGGSTAVQDSEGFNTIGGQSLLITTDGISSIGGRTQTFTTLGANGRSCLSVYWRAVNLNALLYFAIQNTVTGNYWNNATQLWQVAYIANPIVPGVFIPHTNLRNDFISYTTDAMAGNCVLELSNGAAVGNANLAMKVYMVQHTEGQFYPPEPIYTSTTTRSRTLDVYLWNGATFLPAVNSGKIIATYAPLHNQAITQLSDRSIIGSFGPLMALTGGTSQFDAYDSTGAIIGISSNFDRYEEIDFSYVWRQTSELTFRSVALNGGATAPMANFIALGFTGFGSDGNVGVRVCNGYIKNIRARYK